MGPDGWYAVGWCLLIVIGSLLWSLWLFPRHVVDPLLAPPIAPPIPFPR